jgi:hypothetical protein
MNQSEPNGTSRKNKFDRSAPSPARKIGYVVVIIIMFIILYLVRNYEKWNLNFLTADFQRCLVYIELSIYANIGANILFILYDNKWFKHLVQVVTGIASALSIIMIYVIFPITLADETWLRWIKIGLLIIFGLSILGIIIDLVKGIKYLVSEPERI